MSTRFHSKFHRHNHHTDPSTDPRFPDSAYDPIASPDSPFLGAFVLSGTLIAHSPLSAYTAHFINTNGAALLLEGYPHALSATGSTVIQNLTCDDIVINKNFSVFSSLVINNSLSIQGNLPVSGDIINLKDAYLGNNTLFIASSSKNVGINTLEPNYPLTVNGTISSTGTGIFDGDLYIGSLFSVNSVEVKVTPPLNVQNSALITGNLNLSGDLNVKENTTIGKSLKVGPNTLLVNDTNARVGIRTSSPVVELTVNGEISASKQITAGDTLLVGNTTLYAIATSNKVGINTLEPNVELTVIGEISSTGSTYFGDSTLFVDATGRRVGVNTIYPNTDFTVNGEISATGIVYSASGIEIYTGSSDVTLFSKDGKVGINTDAPNVDLTIAGDVSATGAVYFNNVYVHETLSAVSSVIFTSQLTAGDTLFVDSVNKRVGVNTDAPNVDLTVVGDISATGAIYTGSNAFSIDPINKRTLVHEISSSGNAIFSVNLTAGDTLFVDSVNKRVGVNTDAPNVDLTIAGDVSATGTVYFNNVNVHETLSAVNNVIFTSQLTAGDTLFVDSVNKRVGVNTDAPNVDLTIAGDVSATGTVYFNNVNVHETLSAVNNVIFTSQLTAGDTLFVDSVNKRVGVNTDSPNLDLTVVGDISATDKIYGTFIFSTLTLHPTANSITGLTTTLSSVSASDEFLIIGLNGTRRALRLWDF